MGTSISNADKKYSDILSEIETGQIKIPQFQRKFVWSVQASAKLLDSIVKGYPIGTFIYWRTNERLRAVRDIGGIPLPDTEDGEYVNYVLDGQQRITSLYAAFMGVKVRRGDRKVDDFSNIYINLDADEEEDEQIVVTESEKIDGGCYIKITDLLNKGISFLIQFPSEYHSKIDKYKSIIQSYQFQGINLQKASIDVATEVFTRLNVGGKELTLFEIMVAKTFDVHRNFDLEEKYRELILELTPAKFDTIAPATVLQTVSILITKECTRTHILKLSRSDFINAWDIAIESIKKSVDFFRAYGIPVSNLLPYNALIVPFAYFFSKHPDHPEGRMKHMLEDFFWRCSLGYRYSSAVEGKLAVDIQKIDKILNGEMPKYEWRMDVTPQLVRENGWFSTNKSFIKAVLCLYSMQRPKSFNNNLDVNIDNSWLIRADSKNYHHFFPKAYMRKEQPEVDDFLVNHVVNITIVDDYLNKRRIGSKAPARYIGEFQANNPGIESTLRTHLIDGMVNSGIATNDFHTFFNNRLNTITTLLNERLIIQETGNEKYEDVEDTEEE